MTVYPVVTICHKYVNNSFATDALHWNHNGRDGVSNHHPYDCLLNRLFRGRWKKTSKHRVTGLCEWNSPVIGEFPAQRSSNAENVSIWWRHHDFRISIALELVLYHTFWYSHFTMTKISLGRKFMDGVPMVTNVWWTFMLKIRWYLRITDAFYRASWLAKATLHFLGTWRHHQQTSNSGYYW